MGSTIRNLSDQNYERSLTYFRLWSEVRQTYFQLPADEIFDAIYENRASDPPHHTSIYPKASIILRFIDHIESDAALAPQCAGFRGRFCTRILQNFFDDDMRVLYVYPGSVPNDYYPDVNYIAHCANLGYLEKNTIRNHILQSLISHTKMYEHQVSALALLFKIAGATFEAYTDPAVINNCFEILNSNLYSGWGRGLVRVGAFSL